MVMRKNTGAVQRAEHFYSVVTELLATDLEIRRLALEAVHVGRHVQLSASPKRPDSTIADVMTLFIRAARIADPDGKMALSLKVNQFARIVTVRF